MPSKNQLINKEQENWMNTKWRPLMGYMYMTVCSCDFILFPILWSLHQAVNHGQVANQWQPLTLNGAGLFHVAMGAVLGITAYGRTQEKMAGAAGGDDNDDDGYRGSRYRGGSGYRSGSDVPRFGARPSGPGPTSCPPL